MNMLNYSKTVKTDFLLFNDIVPNEIDLGDLVDFIYQYMDCAMYTITELVSFFKPLLINNSDEIIAIGNGGELVTKKLLDTNNMKYDYKNFSIYRKWHDGDYEFQYDMPNGILIDNNIHVIDDVVASGETLSRAREILDPLHSRAFSATVLVAGGNLNSDYRKSDGGLSGYDRLTSALSVLSDSDDDPYWYPAIYSMRHLLFKKEHNPHYLERMSKRYFNGNSDSLEKILESIKNMYLNLKTE